MTTEGLADVIEIGRQDRPSLYDQLAVAARAAGARVAGGTRSPAAWPPTGRSWRPSIRVGCPPIDPDVEAVAVCLLHADLEPAHERVVAEELRARGHDVSCSHEVSPEIREYERTVTTVINAALRPRCRAYLRGLAGLADEVLVMTLGRRAAPGGRGGRAAGGAAAVGARRWRARRGPRPRSPTASPTPSPSTWAARRTDVCLVVGGQPGPAAEREVGGVPGAVAGARRPHHRRRGRLDRPDRRRRGAGRRARRAPAPTRARPATGGAESMPRSPTPTSLPGGSRPTPPSAASAARRRRRGAAALDRAGVTADGVIAVVDANMERALRAVSVERGVDPGGLALVAFGGAGPLHACALADALGMPAVIVPARAGVLSAVGLLTAPRRRRVVRSWPTPQDHAGLAAGAGGAGNGGRRRWLVRPTARSRRRRWRRRWTAATAARATS